MIARFAVEYRSPYPSATDRSAILNYLSTIQARREALEEVRRVCTPVIDRTVERMRAAYPEFGKYHGYGYEKVHRDLTLTTNLATNAMYLGEYDTLDEMFTEWYRTILKASHASPFCVRDTFALWQEELREALSPQAFSLLRPFTEHVAVYLCRIPVPPKDETGRRVKIPPRKS